MPYKPEPQWLTIWKNAHPGYTQGELENAIERGGKYNWDYGGQDPRNLTDAEFAKKYDAWQQIIAQRGGQSAPASNLENALVRQQPTRAVPIPGGRSSIPELPDYYQRLQGILGPEYKIQGGKISPTSPIEYTISHKGQVLPINLRQEARGAFGGIFSGWQSASGQRLTGLETVSAFKSAEGDFGYTAATSMENVAALILESEQQRRRNLGETWLQTLNRITTKAEYSRATYTPWNVTQEAEQNFVRRIPFIVQGEGGESVPPWERKQIGQKFQARVSQALPNTISENKPFTYQQLAEAGVVLKPNQDAFIPYKIRQAGDIRVGPRGIVGREEMPAAKISKGQTIQTQAVPMALEAEKFGRFWTLTPPAPVLPGPQVGPVESNIGAGDIGEKLYAAVMDMWPGGALKVPPKDPRQTGYFIPGVERAEFRGESIQSVLENLILPKELVGREVFPGQQRGSPVRWRIPEGEREVPLDEAVTGRFGEEIPVEASLRHGVVTDARGIIPAYVYRETGLVAPYAPGTKMGAEIRSTEEDLASLKQKFPQIPWERSLTAQNVAVVQNVLREVSKRPRGFIKAGEIEPENVSIQARVGRRSLDIPINFVTGEFKSAGVIRKIFGAQTPENIKGIFGEWAGNVGTEAAQRLSTYVGGLAADASGRMRLSPDILREKYLEAGGQLEGTGNDLLRQIWSNVFYGPDVSTPEGKARNIEHLKRYSAGLANIDVTMPMSKSTREFREQEAMAAIRSQPGNENLSDAEARKIVRRQMTPVTLEGGEPGIRMRGKNAPVMPLIATNVASFFGAAHANEQLIRAISTAAPGWAKQMGLFTGKGIENTGMKAAWTEARSFYLAEISRRRGEGYTPPGATEVSQEQGRQILSTITSMHGAEPKDILSEVNRIINPETGEATGLLTGAGRSIMGTKTAEALDYEGPTGKSVGGLINRYLSSLADWAGGIAAGPRGRTEEGGSYDKLVEEIGGFLAHKPIFKEINSRDVSAGAYSGFLTAPKMPTNALYVPPKLRDFMLRRMGFEGRGLKEARRAFEGFVESGNLKALGVRMPQEAGVGALGFFNVISRKAAGLSKSALKSFYFYTGEAFAKLNIGDWDIDAMLGFLGMQKNPETGKLDIVQDTQFNRLIKGFTNKYIEQQNVAAFEDPALRNQANGTFQMMLDKYGNAENPVLKLFGKAGDVPLGDIAEEMAGRATSKESVGGSFNTELRLAQAVMASGGFPEEFAQTVGSQNAASRYQGSLDDLWRNIQRGGANVTQLVSGARLLREGPHSGMLELAMRTAEGEKWHTMRLDPRKVGRGVINAQNSLPALLDVFVKKAMMPARGAKGKIYQPVGSTALAWGISTSEEDFNRNVQTIAAATTPRTKVEAAQNILTRKSPQELAQTNYAVEIMASAMSKLDPDTAALFLEGLPQEVKERVETTKTLYNLSVPGGIKRLEAGKKLQELWIIQDSPPEPGKDSRQNIAIKYQL